jgi:hypothetical protein
MKKGIFIIILCIVGGLTLQAQEAAYFEPGPAADVTAEITLYVDVSDAGCECPNLVNLPLTDTLYLWTWEPGDPPGGNGAWDASNTALKWVRDASNPNLYSFPMVPTDFYGVDAPTVYDIGISFLIKKFNGADTDGTGENKSVDFHVDILPVGCVDILCAFPEVFQEDDYLTMTYNNNKETNSQMQDLPPDNCYMYPVAIAGGVSYPYLGVSVADPSIVDYPELKMLSEGDGLFSTTILSDTFFRVNSQNPVPDGIQIESIRVQFRKQSFNGTVTVPYELLFQCE